MISRGNGEKTGFLLFLFVWAGGCSSDPNPAAKTASLPADGGADMDAGQQATWGCDTAHNGWEQCSDNRVEYCHIVAGMDPHFHWGADCVSLGLTCVVVDDKGAAACVDNSKPCADADQKCDQNTAYFCVNGRLAQEPCGTAKECQGEQGKAPDCQDKGTACGGHGHVHDATCDCDTGYVVDPSDAKNCIPTVEFPQVACNDFSTNTTAETAVGGFADFENAHVDLDHPYEITLPADSPAYVHFPVQQSGEYVIFLSEAGRFDAFLHRNGQEVTPPASGGVPNGKCSEAIKDHWHTSLVFDADVGVLKVPYIIRFKATPSGGKVNVLLKRKPEAADFPLQSCDMFRAEHKAESVVATFTDFSQAHADLDTPYTVTLPNNAPSYVHFPVMASGEYVLFLSDPSRFDAFMHRNGTDVTPAASGGVANGMCGDLIKDHWHASLTFDGAATDTKVPYVIRFKAVPGGGAASFMIRAKGD